MLSADIREIERDIELIDMKLKPLQDDRRKLNSRLAKAKSTLYIQTRGIKNQDVELSSDEDKPWFGTFFQFAHWIRKNSNKKYLEWNGFIYETSEAVLEKMDRDPHGRIEDLES